MTTTKKKRPKTAKEKRMDEEHLAKMIKEDKEFLINCACDFAHQVREWDYDVGLSQYELSPRWWIRLPR